MKLNKQLLCCVEGSEYMRFIIFEADDSGSRSVCDILEFDIKTPSRVMARRVLALTGLNVDGFTFDPHHESQQFGRSTTPQGKLIKIIDSLKGAHT